MSVLEGGWGVGGVEFVERTFFFRVFVIKNKFFVEVLVWFDVEKIFINIKFLFVLDRCYI